MGVRVLRVKFSRARIPPSPSNTCNKCPWRWIARMVTDCKLRHVATCNLHSCWSECSCLLTFHTCNMSYPDIKRPCTNGTRKHNEKYSANVDSLRNPWPEKGVGPLILTFSFVSRNSHYSIRLMFELLNRYLLSFKEYMALVNRKRFKSWFSPASCILFNLPQSGQQTSLVGGGRVDPWKIKKRWCQNIV